MLPTELFVPDRVRCGDSDNEYAVLLDECEGHWHARYETRVANQFNAAVGHRGWEEILPKEIDDDERFFEVMGLLQGEMSKTNNKKLTFCNTSPVLVNLVLDWFEDQWAVDRAAWSWYIAVNIPEPDADVKGELESKLSEFWIMESRVATERQQPKRVHYRPKSTRAELANNGCLVLECRGPIFVQTVLRLVEWVTKTIASGPEEQIAPYMTGIIAAEATVNYKQETGHRRVFITATKDDERRVFIECLNRLGIQCYDCEKIKTIVISRRENIQRLSDMVLMYLHPDKHDKFRRMLASYSDWWHESRSTEA